MQMPGAILQIEQAQVRSQRLPFCFLSDSSLKPGEIKEALKGDLDVSASPLASIEGVDELTEAPGGVPASMEGLHDLNGVVFKNVGVPCGLASGVASDEAKYPTNGEGWPEQELALRFSN